MLQLQTSLKVIDNSGAKIVKCLKILKKGSFTKNGFLFDLIIISVKKLRSKNRLTSKVKKGDVLFAIILKTRFIFRRNFGLFFNSEFSAVVLLNKQLKPIATRIFGYLPIELRKSKFSKLISLSFGTF